MGGLVDGAKNFGGGLWNTVTGAQGDYWSPTNYNNTAGTALNNYATQPDAGMGAATSQVQNNPLLSGLFGQGGSLQGAEDQEKQLMNTGFQMQPQDNEAYGQASNNIARQYGSQESSLANSLAGRGFGSGASGIAGAQFTGLQGNKNEQLANSQMQIANARMNFAQNALNSTRSYEAQMGQQGENAIKGQQQQTLQGLSTAANQYDQQYGMQNNFGYNSEMNKQGQKQPGMGAAIGQGMNSTAYNVNAAPGNLVQSFAGSAGSTLGGGGLGGGGGNKNAQNAQGSQGA